MSAPIQGSGSGSTQKIIDKTTGTYSHANVTTEEDVLEFIGLDELMEITFDMTTLTQNTTVRLKEKTDGTTYRIIESAIYPTEFDGNNVVIALNGKGRDMKVTFQSAVLEGAVRAIPHARVEELRT